ncbi:ABC transporter ATP-binding protein [Desulfobacter vibrioformis]|uniref:ABC transporter ATP-binding protein n=1 Tax=Desulfobacter vibrioformis TaxID=34031 RepID=UPI00054CFA0E|nr:ABC transporter ATP-binding protein [Desulfobacter vibrioformis]
MAFLDVHHLWFDYGTGPVLQDVCLTAEPGMVSGLLGPNASGKTTLFKCMNGILHPRSGYVSLSGRPVAGMPRKILARIMAVVPQQTGAIFSFTARDMVVMAKAPGLAMWQRPSKSDFAGAEQALADLGAKALARRMYNSLSGGEKQIVLLARAMFQSPSILLLDEPTAHLDFKNQHLMLDMVRTVTKEKGLTTIITLHDPNLASRYCDDIVMLKQGRVCGSGPVRDVFCEDTLESVYGIQVMVTGDTPGGCLVIPRSNATGDVMF